MVVLNTNGSEARGADITVDAVLHPAGGGQTMTYLYQSAWSDAQLRNPPADQTVSVVDNSGRATIRVDLPPAGMAILA